MKAMHQFLESGGNDKSKQPQDTEMIEIRKDEKNCDSFKKKISFELKVSAQIAGTAF